MPDKLAQAAKNVIQPSDNPMSVAFSDRKLPFKISSFGNQLAKINSARNCEAFESGIRIPP
jgi:hypothetical protein